MAAYLAAVSATLAVSPMADYECELHDGDVRVARELWSRQLVVAIAPSSAVLARSEAHAALHAGHAVVSVDGASAAGMSARRFAKLWQAEGAPPTRVVRFRDRKRAELEAALTTTSDASALEPQGLQHRIDACRQKMWAHQLLEAEKEAETLARASAHPLLLLARVEIELIRVLVSKDALALKRARHVAKQTLTSIQALSVLPSLSRASALSVRMALAEALLLSAALQFVAEKNVQGVTEFRRCAAAYAELRNQVGMSDAVNAQATKNAGVPPSLLENLRSRLRFGLGILQLASASAFQGVEWLGAVISDVGSDPARALDLLVECCENESAPRAAWASLALFHSFSAIRTAQQAGIGQKYALKVAQVQRQSLLRYPNSVLHLWSASLSESTSRGDEGRRSSSLEYLSRAVMLSPKDERAHLLRFDAGYRHFVDHDFELSAPLFMDICKCASAPSKLRGLCSVFIAAGYLFLADPSQQDEQHFRSVRLLLRSALRYLDEAKAKDAKAACLHQRISTYVDSADWCLYLLPCEVLYVHCSWSAFAPLSSRDTRSAVSQHQSALEYLDRFSIQDSSVDAMGLLQSQGKVIKLNAMKRRYRRATSFSPEAQAICEWSVLRASVLYQLGEFECAQQQLETLRELLPTVASTSFVRALVVFYSLQIQLQQKLSGPEIFSQEAVKTLVKRALELESQPFEYSYIYAGKLKALATLWAKTTGGASKAQVEVVKRHAASATIVPGSRQ